MGRKSKRALILEKASNDRGLEEKRVTEILKTLGRFTEALNPLIETYLDCYEVYQIKLLEWRQEEFKTTKVHTNKSGARNEIKHPLAQQVEVWMDKRIRLLNQLGLDAKNPKLTFIGPLHSDQEKDAETEAKNRLQQFREQTKKKN